MFQDILKIHSLFPCTGNGKCVDDGVKCENVKGKCECYKGYEGPKCKCCKSGDCKKNCFDRFSDRTEYVQMCSGHGTCDCEGGRNGQKCKVHFYVRNIYFLFRNMMSIKYGTIINQLLIFAF